MVQAYDKSFDRINTRNDKPLEILDRVRYNTSTSDDPIINSVSHPREFGANKANPQLAAKKRGQIFATDSILSVMMVAPRSVNSWDIVIENREGQIFLDKRESSPLELVTVNENAQDAPPDSDDPNNLNSASSLSLEATYINQNFSSQVIQPSSQPYNPAPSPFYSPETETDPQASCLYRYRKFDLSIEDEEILDIVVRTEVDAYLNDKTSYTTVKALNEFDARAKTLDWRKNLDVQRGAIVANEMKNNSAKLARWAVQGVLAGADSMKIG